MSSGFRLGSAKEKHHEEKPVLGRVNWGIYWGCLDASIEVCSSRKNLVTFPTYIFITAPLSFVLLELGVSKLNHLIFYYLLDFVYLVYTFVNCSSLNSPRLLAWTCHLGHQYSVWLPWFLVQCFSPDTILGGSMEINDGLPSWE